MSGWFAVPRYRDPALIRVLLSCGHTLTDTQIPPWGTYRCPHCRRPQSIRELEQLPRWKPPGPSRGRRW